LSSSCDTNYHPRWRYFRIGGYKASYTQAHIRIYVRIRRTSINSFVVFLSI
jgi:hypothetical protein